MSEEDRLLQPLGVSALEERVYRAVLADPECSRAELLAQVSAGERRVAEVVRRLERLGLVGVLDGRPQRIVPVPPDVAVEALLQDRQQELVRLRAAASELVSVYHAARREQPGELVELLSGEQAVARRFGELQATAREELLLFDRPPYAAPPDNPQQVPVLRRGVRWRTVYAPESLASASAREHVERLVAAGEQARVMPGLPLKLVVVDRQTALLPLTLDRALAQTAVIHRSTLLDAMVILFETYWERALPLGGSSAPDAVATGLTDQDRDVLALLVAGAKDEAIARQLGIGVRTLRRRMQHLLHALDADTRFQAGIQAARRGLV